MIFPEVVSLAILLIINTFSSCATGGFFHQPVSGMKKSRLIRKFPDKKGTGLATDY